MDFIHAQPQPAPLALRNKQDAPKPDGNRHDPEETPESTTGTGGTVLVCKACRTRITRRDLGMEVNGSHRHVFFNPHGYVFELGCFASAKNVIPAGPQSQEFTWFPGYAWQVVACSGCNSQLGWRYSSADAGGFYGLILTNLIEIGEKRAG